VGETRVGNQNKCDQIQAIIEHKELATY
jgi:hypothetical protein